MGALKNRLNETVLLSTRKNLLKLISKKILTILRSKFLFIILTCMCCKLHERISSHITTILLVGADYLTCLCLILQENEVILDNLGRDISTWRNFNRFREPRNEAASDGAQMLSTAPIRNFEPEQTVNSDIPYVVPENDISDTREPFNSIENNMRRTHEVPPPSYEAVIAAEAKKDPEEPLPSHKEVENPT